MIELELRWAIMLYTVAVGALAAAIWLYTELRVRRPQRALGQQFLWRCTFCGYLYLDEQDDQLSQCPQCTSFNAADDPKARVVVPTRGKKQKAPPHPEPEEPRRNSSHRKRPHQRRRGPRRH